MNYIEAQAASMKSKSKYMETAMESYLRKKSDIVEQPVCVKTESLIEHLAPKPVVFEILQQLYG